jgi:hypothetical protein
LLGMTRICGHGESVFLGDIGYADRRTAALAR